MWKIGKAEPFAFTNRLAERIVYYIKSAVFHKTILRSRETYPGFMHLFIFWGFLILAIGTGLVAFEDDFFRPLFGITYLHGDFYVLFSFLLDLAGLVAIIGIVMAMIRRYGSKPERLDNQRDDAIALIWILAVLVTGSSSRLPGSPSTAPLMRRGASSGGSFPACSSACRPTAIKVTHAVLYYFHMVISFGLIAYIVFSGRLLHILTSSLNMLFRGVEEPPRGAVRLLPISRRPRNSASTRSRVSPGGRFSTWTPARDAAGARTGARPT